MERKVIEYVLISEVDAEKFSEAVNENLAESWSLYGNPFARSISSGSARYSQAMVKYDESESKKNTDIIDKL